MENVGFQVGGASPSGGSYFTTLLISVGGVVSTTLAIVAYHFIVVRFYLRRRQRLMQMQLQASLSQQPPISQSNGVDEKVLSSIPIVSYSTKNCELFQVDQSECVICLGVLEDGDMVRLLPNCKHVFHNPCIEKWFFGHTNCPVCRAAITVPVASLAALPVENDHDHDQIRDREMEAEAEAETGVNYSPHPNDPEQGVLSTSATTTASTELPKPNCSLRHCVSLVVLERSLSLDQSHVLIDINRERDDKPSSSCSSSPSSKPILVQCGSLKARSMRQLDRMSSVIVRSLSQLRISQSSSMANGHGVLPC